MSAERRFRLLRSAVRDITEIWEFIADDSPSAAERVREEILDAIRRRVAFPRQGHLRSDLTTRHLRFRTLREYLIVYAAEEEPLLVVAVEAASNRSRAARTNIRLIAAMLPRRRSPGKTQVHSAHEYSRGDHAV
jgi:plasmid stabilization system protein ParE